MSPVWIMKAGLSGSAPILAMASSSVQQRIGIGRLVEADVAVGDLHEGEARHLRPPPRRLSARPARLPIMSTTARTLSKPCIRAPADSPFRCRFYCCSSQASCRRRNAGQKEETQGRAKLFPRKFSFVTRFFF